MKYILAIIIIYVAYLIFIAIEYAIGEFTIKKEIDKIHRKKDIEALNKNKKVEDSNNSIMHL